MNHIKYMYVCAATCLAMMVSSKSSAFIPTQRRISSNHRAASSISLSALPVPVVLQLKRSTAAASANVLTAFNMANESNKLAAIAGYSVVATLTLNSCLRLFTSTQLQSKSSKQKNIAGFLFCCFCSAAIVCGAFTSICFTLLTLYSKTALGMGVPGQAKYTAFSEATKEFRVQGFQAFIISISSFLASFILSLYIKLKGKTRYILSAGVGALALYYFSKVQLIMYLAKTLIFE
mmetsp:Transcript_44973/g.88016  ORF Transcript_44973/g.88016 Transcript_44973/m.88016 type:complete len:234 (-) Transcript_44973:122-823(-)